MNTYDYSLILKQLPSFARKYINHLAVTNRSETTRRAYVYELRSFFNYLCNEPEYKYPDTPSAITLDQFSMITHIEIEAYLSYAKTKGENEHKALSRKQAVIKSFYKYLVRKDFLGTDVTLKLDSIEIDRNLPKALEPNEVADLTELLDDGIGLTKDQLKYYKYTRKRDRAIVLTLIVTGMRLSELCSVNLEDINYNSLSIAIVGKGNKKANVYFNNYVKGLLKEYIEIERTRYDKTGTNALFLSMQCKRIGRTSVEDIVKKYMKLLASLGHNTADFSTHKLRSTTATLLLRETDNLALVQDYLRHSDPRTTRQYAKILDEQLKRAASMIKFK